MPIDVSILSQFKPQQPEPLLNTLAQFENIRGARQQQEMNALQLQQARRQMEEQEFENKLYQSALTPEGGIDYSAARRQAAGGGFGRLVPALTKREQEEAKARADAFAAQVKLQTDQNKLLSDKITQFADAARFIETPEAARAWNAALHQDSITGPWFKSIGVTPEQGNQEILVAKEKGDIAGWRAKVLEGKEKITQRLRDQSDLQRAIAAANKKVSPTKDVPLYDTEEEGRRVQADSTSYIQNVVAELQELGRTDLAQTVLKQHMESAMAPYAGLPPAAAELEALRRHPELRAVKERLAELSATRVSVDTGQKAGVEYAKAFGAEVAKQDIKLKEAAENAPRLAADAQRILSALKQKDLITGFGADFRLSVAKALNLVGADNATTISNTENLRASLATQTLSAIKESNLGTGQGFTNQDREFLQDAKSGRIEFDRNSLARLADLAYRAAQESAKRWNARRVKMPAEARDAMGLDEDVVIKPLKEDTMAKPKALSESLPRKSAGKPPPGIPQREWDAMDEEDRELWRKAK
jgi:hypothetical protein